MKLDDPHDYTTEHFTRDPSITVLLKTLMSEAGELARSEANVMKFELMESTRAMIIEGIKTTVYASIAWLGLLSLLAFLILGLGDLLSPQVVNVTGFWVSALIIGLILSIGGGTMAAKCGKQIGRDLSLRKSQRELEKDRHFVQEEIQKIKESAKP